MSVGVWFWVIYVLSLFFGGWIYYQPAPAPWYRAFGGYFVLWLLVGLLGYHAFGPPIR